MTQLYVQDHNGGYTLATRDQIVDGAKKSLRSKFRKGAMITSPSDTTDFLMAELANEPNEIFGALFLNTRHKVLSFEHLFKGTIDGTSVYARVVVQRALELNAAAVIFCHQHPSFDPEPSEADKRLTRRLKAALDLIDVRVLDHIVIGGDSYVSLASRGEV